MILMDIQMPRMNGYEATRKIRALPAEYDCNIPIIAVTANAFEEDRQNAMDAGMNGHIAKPIRLKELRQQLALKTEEMPEHLRIFAESGDGIFSFVGTEKTGCLVVEEKGVNQHIVEYTDFFLGGAMVITSAAGHV